MKIFKEKNHITFGMKGLVIVFHYWPLRNWKLFKKPVDGVAWIGPLSIITW